MPWIAASFALMAVSWVLLWTQQSYWNPLFFFGLWTGATFLVRILQGAPPFPVPRYPVLLALSIPMWWWFEFINGFVANWEYHGPVQYNPLEYRLFASVAFSTVVPALDAAWGLTLVAFRLRPQEARGTGSVWCLAEMLLGAIAQLMVFALPSFFFGMVWVAPALMFDGLMGLAGGPNLARELTRGRWKLPLAVGLAGLGCGFFWEFWNFWATPKWTYHIPFLHFFQIFEMPILGYLGYIPFAWSIYQLVQLLRHSWHALTAHRSAFDSRSS